MKILVAPDKFKGSITSPDACSALRAGIEAIGSHEVLTFPMADGGDGFATVMAAYAGARERHCQVVDALDRPITATYFMDASGTTAIMELAAASGLALINEQDRNIMDSSTTGTGLMIRHAIDAGAKTIIVGIGGSATNDGGMGILHALGVQFMDEAGRHLPPAARSLPQVKEIIIPEPLPAIHFRLAVDVVNPLTGPRGAAAVYGPQKGATEEDVIFLDAGLKSYAEVLERSTGRVIDGIGGLGAAGGVPAGMSAVLDVEMLKGADMVVKASGFVAALKGADLVITGEGKMDEQSWQGKLTGRIADLAMEHGVTCVAVCGQNELPDPGKFARIVALTNGHVTTGEAISNTASVLQRIAPILLVGG